MISAASAEWEEIDEELKYNKNGKLGSGSYGTVYKGEYVLPNNSSRLSSLLRWFAGGGNKIDVAVKRIDPERVKLDD